MALMTRLSTLARRLTGTSDGLADVALILRDRMAEEGAETLPLSPRQRAAYDRAMDAISRLPRPLMALGTLGLLAAAMIDPVWFAARMEALAEMPEPLWWLIGAVIPLWFGARAQTRAQDFQREMVDRLAVAPPAPRTALTPQGATAGTDADLVLLAETPGHNPAREDWDATTGT